MPRCLVFSTVTDKNKRAVAFKHWINVDKDYRTALAYTGFDYDREEELDGISNYFFNSSDTCNIKNFLTFYNYFNGDNKHTYDYYFLINSNLLFPNYFLRDYFKEIISNKIDISSPVFEKGTKHRKLSQRDNCKTFEIDRCSNEVVCLSKRAVKKLVSLDKKVRFNVKTFDGLSFMAINFTPIKYV
jgi:hypothetical protein